MDDARLARGLWGLAERLVNCRIYTPIHASVPAMILQLRVMGVHNIPSPGKT